MSSATLNIKEMNSKTNLVEKIKIRQIKKPAIFIINKSIDP
tara:strand:- start:88 stop:210 length:123 start_codon:yes stop_codon:yes gene_type:complete